jgi:L-rhamnose mutarotase
MFEDFKDKIQEQNKDEQEAEHTSLSPEVLEKLKERGIDPDNFTLEQLWLEVLNANGNDISLMSSVYRTKACV